jgi:alpha-glucosidase
MWRAHAHHEPILRPLFFDFPDEVESYEESDAFMLGRNLLVAPVVEQGEVCRSIWLPKTEGGWYDIRTGVRFSSGEHQVEAPLGAAPVFIRAGSILPLGPSPSWAEGPLTLRLFPLKEGKTQLEIYDDDGESFVDRANPPCLISVSANWRDGAPSLQVSKQGDCAPSWSKIHFEDAGREPIGVFINGTNCADLVTNTLLSENGRDRP